MLGFISNIIFGKADKSPLYEGMRAWDTRDPKKRRAFLYAEMSKWRKEKERLLADYKDKKAKGLSVEQVFGKLSEAVIWETFYDRGVSLSGTNGEHSRAMALETILRQIPDDYSPAHPSWVSALEKVKQTKAVSSYLPGLFDGTAQLTWDRILADRAADAERRRKAEEARKQKQAEERERRDGLRRTLSDLETERSRLMSIFSSMPSGSMDRMQLTVSIDRIDQQISRYKQEIG